MLLTNHFNVLSHRRYTVVTPLAFLNSKVRLERGLLSRTVTGDRAYSKMGLRKKPFSREFLALSIN